MLTATEASEGGFESDAHHVINLSIELDRHRRACERIEAELNETCLRLSSSPSGYQVALVALGALAPVAQMPAPPEAVPVDPAPVQRRGLR